MGLLSRALGTGGGLLWLVVSGWLGCVLFVFFSLKLREGGGLLTFEMRWVSLEVSFGRSATFRFCGIPGAGFRRMLLGGTLCNTIGTTLVKAF